MKESNILCFLTLVIWPCNFKGVSLLFFNYLSFQTLLYVLFVFHFSHFLGADFLPKFLYWSFLECVLSFQLVSMWYLAQRATESDPKHIIYEPRLGHLTSAHVISLAKHRGSFCAVTDWFEKSVKGLDSTSDIMDQEFKESHNPESLLLNPFWKADPFTAPWKTAPCQRLKGQHVCLLGEIRKKKR